MKFTRIALACAFALLSTAAAADSIRPVPIPDMSKLDKAKATQLVEMRQSFDKTRETLLGPPLGEAYALLAASYAQAGFPDAADVALSNAVTVVPEDARWVYLRGILARQRNQAGPARDFFEQAFRLDRSYLPFRSAVVEARIAAGELDSARQLVDQAANDKKTDAKLTSLGALIALREKRPADALAAVAEALRLDPAADQLYTLQAEIYTAQGNSAAANSARARAGSTPARQLDPLGDGFLGVRSGPAPAASANTAAAKPAPADPDDPLTQARFLIEVKQYEAAQAHMAKALAREPGNLGLLGLSARLEAMLGSRNSATAHAAEAVRLAPNDALALVTRGVVAETGGDEVAAQADYEKAIGINGSLTEPRLLLGNRYMRMGRYAQAAEQYRQLARLDGRQADVYARLTAAQVADGRCADALRELDAATKTYPRMGPLLQVYVRLASTCRGTTEAQRKAAAGFAGLLYKNNPTPQVSEAVALTNAATGNFAVAEEMQGSAMFAAVRDGGTEAAAPFREFYQLFQAKRVPDKPWPSGNPLFKPARLQPQPPVAAAPPPKPAD